jgi:hypothetical protein
VIDRRRSLAEYLKFLNELERAISIDNNTSLMFEVFSKNGQVFVLDLREKKRILTLIKTDEEES